MTKEQLTSKICSLCPDQYCQNIRAKINGQIIGRVVKPTGFPEKGKPAKVEGTPIEGCPILKEHEDKVKEIEEESKTQ